MIYCILISIREKKFNKRAFRFLPKGLKIFFMLILLINFQEFAKSATEEIQLIQRFPNKF